ncbi:MAG: PKD domain-containing protein [Candidatus Aminicenantes bacterium]|nr:PKD domain-containing protein [Candidatus Aminicenantes bacterium]
MSRLRPITLILILVLASALPLAATVTFSPAQPAIGQTVTFVLNPAQPNLDRSRMITWNFGDGTSLQTTVLVLTASHAYASSGSFPVSVSYFYLLASGAAAPITEQATVQVPAPNRIVVFSPSQPNVGEPVTFQAQNFLTPNTVDWDFGDGVTINDGGAVQTHTFNAAGAFLVQARDQGGSAAPTTVSVPVTNKRQIQFSPAAPKTGLAVQFQAIQFTTGCIKWSFGDGTILAQGTTAASHIYAKPGAFQVTAQDNCGNSPWTGSTTVSVAPSQGPLAGFDVSYGVLRFADGKTSKLVPRNTTGLAAFADLKFEGTGTIQVEWRVDGQPFRTDSQTLTFAQSITMSSGTLPGLPTATPGPHTVELRFLQPHTAFSLSPIAYTVVAGRPANAGPIVETVTPGELERGKEYELQLDGRNLTQGTSFAFGFGVGIVQAPQFQAGSRAKLKVFVSPTAKLGDRSVKASNLTGTNDGPGKITVGVTVMPKPEATPNLVCPDLSEIPRFAIELKSPWFWAYPPPGAPVQKGDVMETPPIGDKYLHLSTIDDATLLKWDLPFAYYDYVEVRFFKPTGQKLVLKKQLPGSPESLRLSGDVLAELFEALKPSTGLVVNTGLVLTGQNNLAQVSDLSLFGGGSGESGPTYESLYAEGLKAGADIAWQVAAFRVYPCVRDSKSPGGKTYLQQPVEEAVSELWLFNLPSTFTGLACGGAGSQKAGNSIQAVNKTAGDRDQKAGPNTPTSNANFVGDLIELKGSFSLKESPYASHVAAGNSVKIENLFIDWGDGSSAVPVIGKMEGGGSWSKEKKITLNGGLWQSHRYQAEGTHTIRVFQLSEDDIQAPKTDFYAALGEAVTPPQPGGDPYKIILESAQGPLPMSGQEQEPNPLSTALPRAYMIFCSNILINHYADQCAAGPVHLVSLEILNFPGHDIILPGKGSSQDGVMIRKDLVAAYAGIYAVAVQCDQALIARARLRYFGAGSVEITWLVDGIPVQNKTYTLASKERANLGPAAKTGCADAEVDDFVFTSQPFSVAVLGKHNVQARAEFTPQYGMAGLGGSVNQAAANLLAILTEKTGPPLKKDGSGPAAGEAAAAVGGQGYDPFAAKLALEEKAGLAVPQIGLLSPNPETKGRPAVVYLNDALKNYDAPSSPNGPWAGDSALGPGTRLTSETKGYIVNEVRDVKFCRILFPTSGGEFTISDLGSSIQLQGEVYSGKGTLIYNIRTAGAAVEKAFAPGTAFAGWTIEESSGRLLHGTLDATPVNGGTLAFPANISGLLKRFQGQVDGPALTPLTAVFDLELKGVHGSFLASAAGNAGQPPAWKSAAGSLNTEGDWMAAGLSLSQSAIGLTGFRIEAPAVTVDFSRQAAPSNASGEAAGPDWLGVYLDQAVVTPATFGLAGTQSPAMTNLEPWRIKDGGLYGSVRSGSFSAKVDQASVSFNHLDFKVAADKPEGTYFLCAIHVPWIEAILKGDAVLQLISDAEGYGTNWSGLTADPVTIQYADKGRITMTVDGLVWGRDSRGWRARGHAAVATEAEGKPFAAFHLNGLNFGTDGRTYFDGPTWGTHVGLSGNAVFGGATAALKGVQVDAAASGADRLAFGIETEISISPDSSYIPATAVLIHYRIYSSGGADHAVQGPWNSPFSSQVVFPLGSQEIDSAISPSYNYDPNAADPAEDGSAGSAGPFAAAALAGKAGKNMRFGGEIDLAMFGCESVKGAFVLGYQNGKSFFLLFAKYDNLVLPLSPVPLAIFGIGGGFAYNFPAEVFRHGGLAEAIPDMAGTAAFAAVMTIGTTDRFTIMADGYMILSTAGSAEMGFQNAQLMQMGNFGGYINYYNKAVNAKVWGGLDLFGGLINFDLGTEAKPAIAAYFGPGGWYVYAGRKAGPRIKATIFKIGGADSYLELDSKGLRMGGSQKFELNVGPSLLNGYVRSWMDIGLAIGIDPFFMEGSWSQGVRAGGCAFGICEGFEVSATISAHVPNPTFMKAVAHLDFGILGTADLEVGLAL